MFVWGSTPQLGFDEQGASLRPQACQLHGRYERDLRDLRLDLRLVVKYASTIICSGNPGCIRPPP
jgi:hypothetical protein